MHNAGKQLHLIHEAAQELPFRPLGFQSQLGQWREVILRPVEPEELGHHHLRGDPDKLYEHQQQLFHG